MAGLGLACVGWGFVEPYRPEVTTLRITCDKMPAGARPIRIMHVSDIHCVGSERLEGFVPQIVRDLKPDLIAFTGDGVGSAAGRGRFREFIRSLSEIAPTTCIRGNWDDYEYADPDFVSGTGAIELDGQTQLMDVGAARIQIVGVSDHNAQEIGPQLERCDRTLPVILLCHRPDEADVAASLGCDLYLAGHTHGGQVRLPFYGAMVTLSRFGKRFESGLYQIGAMRMYISRGVGMEGPPAPPVRFLCRPEITLIELTPAQR